MRLRIKACPTSLDLTVACTFTAETTWILFRTLPSGSDIYLKNAFADCFSDKYLNQTQAFEGSTEQLLFSNEL